MSPTAHRALPGARPEPRGARGRGRKGLQARGSPPHGLGASPFPSWRRSARSRRKDARPCPARAPGPPVEQVRAAIAAEARQRAPEALARRYREHRQAFEAPVAALARAGVRTYRRDSRGIGAARPQRGSLRSSDHERRAAARSRVSLGAARARCGSHLFDRGPSHPGGERATPPPSRCERPPCPRRRRLSRPHWSCRGQHRPETPGPPRSPRWRHQRPARSARPRAHRRSPRRG